MIKDAPGTFSLPWSRAEKLCIFVLSDKARFTKHLWYKLYWCTLIESLPALFKKQSNSCLGCTFSYGKESSQYFSCKKCAPFRKLIHIIYQMWKRKSSALQAISPITWQNINGGVEQDREHGQFFKLMCPSSSDFFPHKKTFKVQSKGKEGELFNTQPFHETVFLQSGQCRAIWIRLSSARHPVLVNWERWSYWAEIWQHCWKWSDSTNRSVNL